MYDWFALDREMQNVAGPTRIAKNENSVGYGETAGEKRARGV